MIKLKSLILKEEISFDEINRRYPIANNIVDGREILDNIDNCSSISTSLTNYKVLNKVREVPMSDFNVSGRHYSVQGTNRIKQLAAQIQESNTISPLIVVIDNDGPYILEGATRIDALKTLNAKSFPALVVIDYD